MKIEEQPKLDLDITFRVNEAEARALEAMMGYGFDAFIKVFKVHLGRSYIEEHERALRKFFEEGRPALLSALSKIDEARKHFK